MRRRRDLDYYEDAHDERVEPGHDLVPPMPAPDWGGVIVHPNQKKMPVGDPTLWANTVTTQIDTDPRFGSTPRVIQGDQIILAQAADRYSRSWSLIGSVTIPFGAAVADTNIAPPGSSAGDTFLADNPPLAVWLSVVQGIEKITIEQQILLLSGVVDVNVVPPIGNFGLCNNQTSGVGGPYGITYNITPIALGPDLRGTSPFACVGAFIGNTISARAIFVRGGVIGQPADVPDCTVSLLITPYAPGAGI